VRLFGLQITRAKAAVTPLGPSDMRGWFGVIRESFAGAFGSFVEVDAPREIVSYAGLYAPLTLVAGDIGKLRIKLTQENKGIWEEIKQGSPFLPVLRKPNHFQTLPQFIEMWILMKLIYGNVYIVKDRDARGVVKALYILDSERVRVTVSTSGDIYYRLSADYLSGLPEGGIVAASEIIHDRMNCFWHPLCGVPPLYAAGLSATQGRKIQNNSSKFFENMSRPGGMLTAPDTIDDQTAKRLKAEFEGNFSGGNIGRLFVGGDGLEYKDMSIPAEQAQLIEQLEWTVKDVARAFLVPYFMVGGDLPATNSIEAETTRYYNQTLQKLIEQAEACLDEGLSLPSGYKTAFDLDGLIRMDTTAQAEAVNKLVAGGVMTPNEGRARFNLAPVKGGDTPYLQQQNYGLGALAARDALPDPFGKAPPPPAPTAAPMPAPAEDDEASEKAAIETAALIEALTKGLEHVD
jgi:HK97 family phage portal protein